MRRGGEKRGNNRDRRARKLWLLATFDPELGPDEARCRLVLSDRCLGLLDYASITADLLDMGGGGRREVTDWLEDNPPPVFREWLTEWYAANREQVAA